ncbi:MAG TPA: hypothetical protein DCP92_24200 [Nitrospiraceae bacterium]|jgi:predicted double-glycine peptidase|nr:hypothetical protein [Nitrospiraceae bacterium]
MKATGIRRESAVGGIPIGIRFSTCCLFLVACWFLLLSLSFVSGCAHGSSKTVLQQDKRYGYAHIIRGLPFYPQEDYQCGPASLASVLNYWGSAVSPTDIAKHIYSRSARGTLNVDMVLYAEARGLEAFSYSGGLDDVRAKIEAGYPLIVLVDEGFSFYQVNHFMVLAGYSDDGVIVNSGRKEGKFIPTGAFLKLWERTKFWTLFIRRK